VWEHEPLEEAARRVMDAVGRQKSLDRGPPSTADLRD
jgi:hypothetical protein